MKSFFLFTLLAIAVSIACSGYKSAGSPTVSNGNTATNQVSVQEETPPTQDKPKCELTLVSVPTLIGLKLGMTANEVLAVFPGSSEDAELRSDLARPPNAFGGSSFGIVPSKYQGKEKFAGITQIGFSFLDGRVSSFTFNYNGPEYPHVDRFVEKFVDGTGLPAADQWEAYPGLDTQMKTLTCKDFEIRVFASGKGGDLNYILVKDLAAEETLKDRRKKARAQPSPSP
jgi:hypothetical protein